MLLCAVSAAPVFADPEEPPPAKESAPLPDPGEITLALEQAELKQRLAEEEAKKALESPAAIQEREDSREEYADLDALAAQDLLLTSFTEQLKALNADPARVLSDLEVEKTLGTHGAQVTEEDGSTALVESPIPIESELAGAEEEQVDLSLQDAGAGYEPQSAFTEVRLPDTLSGTIEIGESLAIDELPGDGNVTAARFGDKDLFFANTDTATDTLISPIARGVEIFEQLRSPESPEQFRFGLALPEGATLKPDGHGGAEILDSTGERIGAVPAPLAADAQGTDVPVTLSVEGDALLLDAPHRSLDIAYPVLLDPILENWENWSGGANGYALTSSIWAWQETADYENAYGCIVACWGPGLYSRSKGSSYWYAPNTYGQWVYTAPNQTAYISRAVFQAINGSVHNCFEYQPHGYVGIYNTSSSSYTSLGVYSPTSSSGNYDTGWVGGGGVRNAITGIGTASKGSSLACGHDFAVGGAMIWEDDPENPTLSSISGIPTGWVSDKNTFTISAKASDSGLGIQTVTITPKQTAIIQDQVGCSGLAISRCPSYRNSAFKLTGASFDEGEKSASLTASDPLGKTVQSPHQWTMKVDRTPPEVTLGGQLAFVTDEEGSKEPPPGETEVEELNLPAYNLQIDTKDGSSAKPEQKRSGVKNIQIYLDKKLTPESVPWSAQSCPASSCEMNKTYTLKLSGLTAGQHVLRVVVTDQVSEKREREIEFEYIPATGMKDSYVMHYFPLPDGEGDESQEEQPERPEFAVNVMNGNLVYRELDVDVEGYSVDLEVERFYNSQLPEADDTEWGDGWTLAQTPELEPKGPEGKAPESAELIDTSGALDEGVELPTEVGEEAFDPELQVSIEKEAGGYELTDESGESSTTVAFDAEGQAEELRTEGYAKVDLDYEAGELSEIVVKDPASASSPVEEQAPPRAPPTLAAYIGSGAGTGNGQLNHPGDVAIDAKGNTWVVDELNNRIQKFAPDGSYAFKFGTKGEANGQLDRPTAIALDAQGDLWITDAGNHRVQQFAPDGSYISKFGSEGSGGGFFSYSGPEGIAIDPKGNVWVSDGIEGHVEKFNSEGKFIQIVGATEIAEPTGIDIGPGGNLWVADWSYKRVEVFDESGKFIRQFGTTGSGEGQLQRPDAIDVDSKGNVWVGDEGNDRVVQFDEVGNYITQFGSYGSGPGQFELSWPMGVTSDGKGGLYVTDTDHHKVQKWTVPDYLPAYSGSAGSSGTGDGQLNHPSDVAIGENGAIWLVDELNNRIQRFNLHGEFRSKFGEKGSTDGKLNRPTAIALDAEGDLWVADSNNFRVQQFSTQGKFISKFGAYGTGNGQFSSPPEGLAIDPKGNIWVSDGGGRIEKFNSEGKFLAIVGKGKVGEPTGIDIGPGGNLWVTDWVYDRVSVFDEAGNFIRHFGTSGTGDGQFKHPDAVDVDAAGNVWVADEGNDRIQQFNQLGEYVAQFGSYGSGDGQLNLTWPMGIATDDKGRLYVADTNNHRVQEWLNSDFQEPVEADDPAIEIETEGDLVESVEGEEAGEHSYEHEGELLSSYEGPGGETDYGYDTAGRLNLVELPNGTKGSVTYFDDSRVKSVTVDPAGAAGAETTYFEYADATRRTTVTPYKAPAITYDIGADGSVLKWWNAVKAPEFDDLAGSLYANRETASPITSGDHNLVTQAYSAEGIASIEVIANGYQLVDEVYCDAEKELSACVEVSNEWVTDTASHAPGVLDLEVIITDRLGATASERFWVNIPQPPPPPAPGTPVAPKFADVVEFRVEHGLDLDLDPVKDEAELNDRVFDLIGDWHNSVPIARASAERWGAPLRAPEVAELDDRIADHAQAAEAIPAWAEANASSSYAGYYVDEPAGGVIRVGFTGDQASQVASLVGGGGLVGADRVEGFPVAPEHSLSALESLEASVQSATASMPAVTRVSIELSKNKVLVGASNVAQVESELTSIFGSKAPISVNYQPHSLEPRNRERSAGPVHAGDVVYSDEVGGCSAGFGAWEDGKKTSDRKPVRRYFLLVAAHCFTPPEKLMRYNFETGDSSKVGVAKRTGAKLLNDTGDGPNIEGFNTDATAVRVDDPQFSPRQIYESSTELIPVHRAVHVPGKGTNLCHSGAISDETVCGPVTTGVPFEEYLNPEGLPQQKLKVICYAALSTPGDSGGPVWIEGTPNAVGFISMGSDTDTCLTPLVQFRNHPEVPGAFKAPGMGDLHIRTLRP